MSEVISQEEKEYMKKWIELNSKMSEKGFTWSMLEEDEEFHQYMSFNVLNMSKDQWGAIQTATKKIGNIINKTYKILLKNSELRKMLNLPKETLNAITVPSEYFSYFTRLDLIVNGEDIKVIEINCDTPTGYLETSVANEIICEDKGLQSPNQLEYNIFRAWRMIEKDLGINFDKVYFTSYGEHEEDKQTVLFNMKHSGVNGEYIAVEDIQIDEYGIYDTEGNKIEYLYRLYPLEFLPEDVDEHGEKIGEMFLDHIASGKVKIINPPSAFMMQSKAVMAVVWGFASDNRLDFFTQEELSDISKYFLPTYFSKEYFTEDGTPYVEKPIFGREGGGVKILNENSNIVEKDEEDWYSEWSKIYQQYVEMPEMTVDTWAGKYTGKLLIGSFLIGGEPSGVFLRVGEKITGNLSMFCGVAVNE
ncbi:glutathionylspermidine synthase family protein [Bacillus subtilis]|uniref:Glutathionylspermidine synthase family protein n=1 Tax=Bacillus phage vB_BsuS_PJN02 TaxID=2920374 RepID=A0AC61TS23_9CAUD|nr:MULTISPECIES: glutathionylspermidine synthase family protein [Bacillus subtilis group]YP_010681768.1 glutathionylspermidine synthase [Bacillus phage vB_BsuS_PJN02]MCR4362072.1 glutathionylspermidine synthase family protein [Bacillus subtilis]UNH58493.1 glutathionylspermidine synthase family protein [Bacillus phage vB_BsuS_PJN02]UQB84315.1 glutathionylspermidine synthase family protein [Bacillus amyloliquefaciens]WOF32948.1 glutathionylspermidine synthase family protein [Bacillus subtilis]